MNSIEPTDEEIGRNIINAMKVVMDTYANVKALADALDEVARHNTSFKPLSGNVYLTWMSPKESYGWLYRFVIKAYKKEDNVLYTVEISLDDFNKDLPAIILGKHSYDGNFPVNIYTNPSVATLSQRHHRHERYEISPDGRNVSFGQTFISKPRKDVIDKTGHEAFQHAIFKKIPLIGIKKSEIKEKIFDSLSNLHEEI